MIEIEFINEISEPLEEVQGIPIGDNFTIFETVAITKGISMNGRLYTVEILEEITKQLKGLPVMYGSVITPIGMKHQTETEHVVGEVLNSWFNRGKNRVECRVKVMNTHEHPDVRDKINAGILKFVSIGGHANLEETYEDYRAVTEIRLNHLSLVAVPGDLKAKIFNIIQENVENFSNVCIPHFGCIRIGRKHEKIKRQIERLRK